MSDTTTAGGDTTLGNAGNATDTTKVDAKTTDTKVDAKTTDTTKADPAAEKLAADKAAADEAAKPFTDLAQLKFEKGAQFDEKLVKDVLLPLAKEHGLTAKQAKAIVEADIKRVAAQAEAQEQASKRAVETLKGDKEIGGAQFDASMKLAGKALAFIGLSKETQAGLFSLQLADGSMLGDNVVFAKILVGLGKKVAEDTTKGTHSNGAKTPANDAGALQRALYDHPTSKNLKFD